MTLTNDLWRLVAKIREAELAPIDRELLRPTFAAYDESKTIAVPDRVTARIRDIAARMPKAES
jgi:hypothetical protein